MNYKNYIAEKINIEGITSDKIESLIVIPPDTTLGDYALPCFSFAKVLRKSPQMIADSIKNEFVTDDVISEVNSVNGYLNFKVNRLSFSKKTIDEILGKNDSYGSSNIGQGKTVCIDYSSINIAKAFHIGHLSTTVIGSSLYKTFKFLGYNVVGINHLGDYGTQFGKLIYAYKNWGSYEVVEKEGITELTRLYVKFHEEAEKNPELEDSARHYFKLIEDGDKECNELFDWFKKLTLKDAQKIYDELDVTFDSYAGESFYNDKMQPVVDELNEKGLLKESEGAKIVDLSHYNMPPCIILRSDGASLYATRDLAAAFYRKNTYNFDKCLYVVAYQQNLHFKQIFKVLELMGKPWYKDMEHVAFGMVSLLDENGNQVAMSTRKGTVVLLKDVIQKCHKKCLEVIEQKNPNLEDKENVAKIVGTGAVIFGALSNSKIKDIAFSYEKVLSFEGETGPYVQYTATRCKSVLRKAGEIGEFTFDNLNDDEYNLISKLSEFGDVVKNSAERTEPYLITRYSLSVASLFNKFYFDHKIIGEEDNVKNKRLAITKATLITLTNALKLLGIKIPERM